MILRTRRTMSFEILIIIMISGDYWVKVLLEIHPNENERQKVKTRKDNSS